MLPIRTILHPTDFSEQSTFALNLACALARDYDAELCLVHVAVPPTIAYGEGIVLPPDDRWMEDSKFKLIDLPLPDPKVRVHRKVVEGNPAPEILRLARALNCDLIVMGTHGRTGVGRLLMGSVAEEVTRHAPCPVMTVKTPSPLAKPARAPAARTTVGKPEATPV